MSDEKPPRGDSPEASEKNPKTESRSKSERKPKAEQASPKAPEADQPARPGKPREAKPREGKGREAKPRDGRFALHNATVDKAVTHGDVKINGVASPTEVGLPGVPPDAEAFVDLRAEPAFWVAVAASGLAALWSALRLFLERSPRAASRPTGRCGRSAARRWGRAGRASSPAIGLGGVARARRSL